MAYYKTKFQHTLSGDIGVPVSKILQTIFLASTNAAITNGIANYNAAHKHTFQCLRVEHEKNPPPDTQKHFRINNFGWIICLSGRTMNCNYRKFSNESEFEHHLNMEHKVTESTAYKLKLEAAAAIYNQNIFCPCNTCTYSCRSVKALHSHIATRHNDLLVKYNIDATK